MNKVNELSPEMKKKYLDKAKDSKDSHQRIAKDYKTRTGSADSPKNDWTDHMASVHQRKADSRAKGIKRADEKVTSADKKPEMYTDEKGRRRVRMVKTDKEIIKQEEGYIGGKGEKGRDKGNAGKFDKNTAYSHAKTHNGVVHKDTSGSYLVKHGRGKNVSEEPVAELSTKTLQSFADKSWKNPKRAQGVKTAAGKIVKKALEKESTYTAKVPKKHDPSKDISVADYKKKTGKKTVSLKHLTKNTHVNPFTEESVELGEAINFRKAHQEIMAYAKKHGDIDKEDFEKVASYIKAIGDNQNKPDRANLRFATMKAFVAGMDTDPRDKVYSWLKKYGMFKNGKMVQESESVDEVYRKPPTPIGGKGSSAKYKEAEAEYDREKSFARIKQQRKSRQTNVKTEKSDPCWDDHEMVGTKKKNGKTVPNCVPKESVVLELTDKERAEIERTRAKKAPARDADGRSSVKRQQKKKDAAANPKKAAAPKPVKSKPKTTYDDKADLHPIIQLRKVVDTKGIHTPVFHKGKTGKVSADDAHHVLKLYDKLPVMGKRQLKIRLAKGGPAAVKQAAAAHRSLGK